MDPNVPKLFLTPRKDSSKMVPDLALMNDGLLSRLPDNKTESTCGKCKEPVWIGPETKATHSLVGGNLWCPECVIGFMRSERAKFEAKGQRYDVGVATCGEFQKNMMN